MRRVFWMAVGAAGGIWAYQRGADALERARERGVVGNAVAATAAASRVAATTTRAVAAATEQGARLAGRLVPPPDAGAATRPADEQARS